MMSLIINQEENASHLLFKLFTCRKKLQTLENYCLVQNVDSRKHSLFSAFSLRAAAACLCTLKQMPGDCIQQW